jgi:hypothetical protein
VTWTGPTRPPPGPPGPPPRYRIENLSGDAVTIALHPRLTLRIPAPGEDQPPEVELTSKQWADVVRDSDQRRYLLWAVRNGNIRITTPHGDPWPREGA